MKNKWIAAVVCGILVVIGAFSVLYAAGLFSVRTAEEEKKIESAPIQDSPPFYREREVKIAKGELPEDQPRMTEEQARRIISKAARTDSGGLTEAGMDELIGRFNMLGGIVTLFKPDPDHSGQSVMINLVTNEVLAPPPTSLPAK